MMFLPSCSRVKLEAWRKGTSQMCRGSKLSLPSSDLPAERLVSFSLTGNFINKHIVGCTGTWFCKVILVFMFSSERMHQILLYAVTWSRVQSGLLVSVQPVWTSEFGRVFASGFCADQVHIALFFSDLVGGEKWTSFYTVHLQPGVKAWCM